MNTQPQPPVARQQPTYRYGAPHGAMPQAAKREPRQAGKPALPSPTLSRAELRRIVLDVMG